MYFVDLQVTIFFLNNDHVSSNHSLNTIMKEVIKTLFVLIIKVAETPNLYCINIFIEKQSVLKIIKGPRKIKKKTFIVSF